MDLKEFSSYNDNALEGLSKGDVVLVYDPKHEPEVFKAALVNLTYDRSNEKIIGAILTLLKAEEVEVPCNRGSYVMGKINKVKKVGYTHNTLFFAPLYRIGYSAYRDVETMPFLDDYES